ncbi:hypothetical protein F5B17DRAFT_420108 [Nemania serpens]|nr:hypothetical protein F5B17DRAFT_420108 [Nemania serpens]
MPQASMVVLHRHVGHAGIIATATAWWLAGGVRSVADYVGDGTGLGFDKSRGTDTGTSGGRRATVRLNCSLE